MFQNHITSFFNNRTIGFKIALGFIFILILFIYLSFFIIGKIGNLDRSVTDLSTLSKNTVIILDINNDVSELQRMALIYSQSGSESIFKKMQDTYKIISNNLLQAEKNTSDTESQALIQNMNNVVKRYGENLNTLNTRYQYRKNLIEVDLPEIRNTGITYLKTILSHTDSKSNLLIITLKQSLLQLWLESNLDAIFFLKDKQYRLKKSVYKNINTMIASYNKLAPLLKHDKNFEKHNFLKLISRFKNSFEKSIQANRAYLSLLKVVMAGEALEFTTISNKLRAHTLLRLDKISEKSKVDSTNTDKVIKFALLAAIPFFVLIGIYYNYSISKGIKAIAKTFTKLVDGNFSHNIPGLNRKDEIGQLAVAANAFKDVSKKVKEAQIDAEELTRVKSEFLANMSHEIRTPMNGILGMISLLNDTQLSKQQKGMLKTISSSGDSLMTILNDILDLSKADSGKIQLENKSFSLAECVKDISFMFTNMATEKDISFHCYFNPEFFPKYIIGDITRLKQILINLLSNAVKFTDHGSVTFKLHCTKIADTQYNINFIITDSGIGISDEAKQVLFKAFSQADTSITRKFGGTGLGLVISSKLANLFGSKITIDSSPGKGSTFKFDVNFFEGEKIADHSQSVETAITKKDYNILLVEDNLVNTQIATMMLKKLGYDCDVAENGQIAVDLVTNNIYDLIFMDMQMPVMDGIQATKLIRQDPQGKVVSIIAMTANVMQDDRDKCFEAGMDDFITKPVSLDVIGNVITNLTNNSHVS